MVGVEAVTPCGTSPEYYGYFNNPCSYGGYSFIYYPNPASETLTIEKAGNETQGAFFQTNSVPYPISQSYKLYNIQGNVVLQGVFSNSTTLDVSTLNTGLYILKIETEDNQEETHRIIVK